MLAQVWPRENIVVLTSEGPNTFCAKKLEPPDQGLRKKGLKDEVKVLGTIQLLCGLMILTLGILLASASFAPHFSPVILTLMKSGYPFIGATCFVICGLLSIVSEKKPSRCLAWSNLAVNVVSLVTAIVGLVLLAVQLAATTRAWEQCELDVRPTRMPQEDFFYHAECFLASSALLGVLSVMFVLSVLELSVAIPTSILWWREAHPHVSGNMSFLPRSNEIISNLDRAVFNNPNPGFDELDNILGDRE